MTMLKARYPEFDGAGVIVTGGASGIGLAIAAAFHAQGAKVGILDRHEMALKEATAALPGLAAETVDLRDIPATRLALARLVTRIGPPGILVNNAAHDARHAFDRIDVAEWDERMAVNLRHVPFVSQALVPAMRAAGRGVILNLGSTAWMKGAAGMIAYATAKSAIEGFTRALSREVGPEGIRVNAIAPGWVMTTRQIEEHATPEKRAANLAAQAIRREVLPEDIAAAALFLCSDGAGAITGQTLIVDGGTCYG
ncbi:MAG: SDR family NAD(P)-dependent oxidoreductase [Beijerinckiaceae bacterium]|jgi:NAD(P)-dependent dehydrogenase (short-subunit alcohol dehydrogenase family)|nr:SDR family NAD(P)-dependent oxidoreductase [Beijerinckiaceae bacterium]